MSNIVRVDWRVGYQTKLFEVSRVNNLASVRDLLFCTKFMAEILNNRSRYARERAAEEPLAQASSNPANFPVSEFPTKKDVGTRSPRPIKSPREVEVNERRHEDSAMMPHLPGRERGVGSDARCLESELPARLQLPMEIQRNFDAAAWGCKRY